MKLITTSWDDGHRLDGRLADLLCKYGLQGTFYVPAANTEHEVMTPHEVRSLAQQFEIGGHTLHHVRLNVQDRALLEAEVKGSFRWLQELLGKDPVCFCFPGGRFNSLAVASVFRSGYKLARTTDLLDKDLHASEDLLPTTLQVFPHSRLTYCKHLLRRGKWGNLARWIGAHSLRDLSALTESYLERIDRSGGCFHLWGHSWEIEEYGLWERTESIFRILSRIPGFKYIQNKEILSFNRSACVF